MKKNILIALIVLLLIILPINVQAKHMEILDENIYVSTTLNYPFFKEYRLLDGQDVERQCNSIFGGKFGLQLKQILNIVKFFVPIIIIALAVADFIKALTAQSQDEVKKATNKLVKRLIIGILIFVLPTILEFVLKLAGIEFGVCAIK